MEISIQRLWLLIKKQWVDHQKMYWLSMLAMAGIMIAIFLPFTNPDFYKMGLSQDVQAVFFFIGLIFFGAIFTSTLFNQFAEKPTGIQALMLPASALEKTITAILYSNVFFPWVYGLIIYPIVVVAHFVDVKVQGNLNELFSFNFELMWGFIILCFLVQNIALFCSILFRRYTFIKTAILVCILFFGSFYLNQKIVYSMVENTSPREAISIPEEVPQLKGVTDLNYRLQNAIPFYGIGFFISDRAFVQVKLPKQQTYMYNFFIYGFIIVLLWVVTWFKLREKQV